MKRSLPRTCLLAALLASPLAMAVGTGPTHPDDPHKGAPTPGVDSTLNPTQDTMPTNPDSRVQGNGPDSPPARQEHDNPGLPGQKGTGSERNGDLDGARTGDGSTTTQP